jgi:NADH-quinone oxidoreductase subunit K
VLSAVLFAIGVFGVIARRNLLIILMSIEVMLNAVNLAFIAFARHHSAEGGGAGHVFVLMIMAVAAAEAAVGLAILLALFRNKQTVDADEVNLMKN